jgi:hypothetical protein
MSIQVALNVYQRTVIVSELQQNFVELSPETAIRVCGLLSSLEENDVNAIMRPLKQVWNVDALPAANGMKHSDSHPNFNLQAAIRMQKFWTGTKLTAADLVKTIEKRRECVSNAVNKLTEWKERVTAEAQKEAVAQAKALAKTMNRKETEVSVSMSSKRIHWNEALKRADEVKQSWEVALFNIRILSQAIHETCQAIDDWVQRTDHICHDSWLKIDEDIETITAAFTAAEDKISKAIEATKKAFHFSSQPNSSL